MKRGAKHWSSRNQTPPQQRQQPASPFDLLLTLLNAHSPLLTSEPVARPVSHTRLFCTALAVSVAASSYDEFEESSEEWAEAEADER